MAEQTTTPGASVPGPSTGTTQSEVLVPGTFSCFRPVQPQSSPSPQMVTGYTGGSTVEPLYNGHIGAGRFVHYKEVSFIGRLVQECICNPYYMS